MRRRARTDANHAPIVEGLREVPGVTVHSTAQLGEGFPDAIAGYRGANYLFEFKDGTKPPSARRLTPDEREWHARWRGQVHVVHTVYDCLKVMGIEG